MRTVEVPEVSAPPDGDGGPDAHESASTDGSPPTTSPRTGGIDWSGRSPAGGSDDHGDGAPPASAAGGSGTRRLAVVAGVVSFAYVLWVIVDLVVLASSGLAYTTMHEALGSLGFRVVVCLAWLALLYHGLDGLRLVLVDFVPRAAARDRLLRGAVAFVLFAAWIPTSLVIIWPAIRRWFA